MVEENGNLDPIPISFETLPLNPNWFLDSGGWI